MSNIYEGNNKKIITDFMCSTNMFFGNQNKDIASRHEQVVGIDLGSRAVKLIVLGENKLQNIIQFDTAKFYREYGENRNGNFNINLEKLNISKNVNICATGYGRNNLNINNASIINELKAHVFGAIWQTGEQNFVLLDIGGQDSKIIQVIKGKIADIELNDKCAASCGRYLENMANVLGISTNTMSTHFENPVTLSSTCAVFAESELIGKISEGISIEELSAGVNYSLFNRIKPLIERFSSCETLVVTGGVAKNRALLEFISKETDFSKIIVPKYCQENGAIGAASTMLQ